MTMTLEQVRDALREYQSTGHVFNVKMLADAITSHLSQPQPVAHGEIKAWGHRNDPANVISDRNKREMERYEGINGIAASVWDVPFYAAPPTIPTGRRVVPVEDASSSLFIMDGVTVQISGDQESIDRVMGRIYKTSDRLGNYLSVVLPDPSTKDNYEQDEDGQIDSYSYGHMDGWNSCRTAMLAAAHDAGGV